MKTKALVVVFVLAFCSVAEAQPSPDEKIIQAIEMGAFGFIEEALEVQSPNCQASIDAAIALLKPLEPLLTPKGVTNLRNILTRLNTLKTQCKPVAPLPNAPPEVTLTSPPINSKFVAPATITITAAAVDGDGMILKVEFFAGTTLIGTDSSSPYQYTWMEVPVGTYSLTAKAFDDKGASKTSDPVNVVVEAAVPIPPPSGSTDAYAETLCALPGALCYRLQTQAEIDKYRHPGEVKVNYDPQMNAAKWQWIKDDESADNLRLPISLARPASGTSKLLIIADHRWDSAWFTEFKDPNGEFLGGWKWMQVTSASGPGSSQQRIWFEPQMRALGENPFKDDPPVLSLFGAREYLDVLVPTTNEGAIGCGIDFGESVAINRQMGCFKGYPNTWTRSWIEITLDANAPVLPNGAHVAKVSWWLADENQIAVPIFLNAQLGYFSPILQFWYEYDTSRPERIGGQMAAWGKNVIVLKDVADVIPLLQRPVK